ncbi:YoaK family protein [Synechocystis sp. LKSZ1]|uniref:YoaK family protein n=1 Tax=Synechocystis sp. LKSZ1 TaxID=3144951 RepID=UPI00336BF8EE
MKQFLNHANILALLLSGVAGFVDATSFLGLNHLFTAHITGNLVVAVTDFVGVGPKITWIRLTIIPLFMAAVMGSTLFSRFRAIRPFHFFWLEASSLLVFTGFCLIYSGLNTSPLKDLALFLAGSLGVISMGIHNTAMRETLGNLAPTTAMTNNLTQFTMDLSSFSLIQLSPQVSPLVSEYSALQQRLGKFGSSLLGFSLGAMVGGLLTHYFGFGPLLLPTLTMAGLALQSQVKER